MHMRLKKWAKPELAACPYYIKDAKALRGHWAEQFAIRQPLHVELGCGKGVSTSKMVHENPQVNYVAIDIAANVMGYTRRNLEKEFDGQAVTNALLASFDISYIDAFFAPEDQVERIYISFCNPWGEKRKHEKRRLTHPRQLEQYKHFMKDGGEIWFKTDDDGLFDDSLKYFADCGFTARYVTRDLHASGFQPNYESEHEKMFTAQGIATKFVIAVQNSEK